jgi:hypothetical protein
MLLKFVTYTLAAISTLIGLAEIIFAISVFAKMAVPLLLLGIVAGIMGALFVLIGINFFRHHTEKSANDLYNLYGFITWMILNTVFMKYAREIPKDNIPALMALVILPIITGVALAYVLKKAAKGAPFLSQHTGSIN